jgi:hypothetical protein
MGSNGFACLICRIKELSIIPPPHGSSTCDERDRLLVAARVSAGTWCPAAASAKEHRAPRRPCREPISHPRPHVETGADDPPENED